MSTVSCLTAEITETPPKRWTGYILESNQGDWYVGVTQRITKRLAQHKGNTGTHFDWIELGGIKQETVFPLLLTTTKAQALQWERDMIQEMAKKYPGRVLNRVGLAVQHRTTTKLKYRYRVIGLPQDIHQETKEYCKQQGLFFAAFVERAIRAQLDRHKQLDGRS